MTKTSHSDSDQLDAFLTSRQRGEQPTPVEISDPDLLTLADHIHQLTESVEPDAAFAAALEKRFSRPAQRVTTQRNPEMKRRFFSSFGTLIPLAGALVLLVFALVFLLPRLNNSSNLALKPLPALGGPNPTGLGGGIANGAESLPVAVEPGLDIKIAPNANFSGTQFILATDMPGFSGPLAVYLQAESPSLSLEAFRQLAARFGVEGPIYTEQIMILYEESLSEIRPAPDAPQTSGESESPSSYLIFDGMRQVMGGSYWNGVTYMDRSVAPVVDASDLPSFDQLAATAEAFLNEHGLLDFPYTISSDPYWPASVLIQRQVGGYALTSSEIEIIFGAGGRIQMVSYHPLSLETIADYPLRSAQSAWEALLSNQLSWEQMSFSSYMPTTPDLYAYKSWQPVYRAGEPVEKLGYLTVYQPAEGEQALPRLVLNDLELQASASDLETLANLTGRQILVTGKVEQTERGAIVLAVESWRESEEYSQYVTGAISRTGRSVVFTRGDGKLFILPHAPDNLPDGIKVDISGRETGVQMGGLPVFEWDSIQFPASDRIIEPGLSEPGIPVEVEPIQEVSTSVAVEDPNAWMPPNWEPGKSFENLEGQLYASAFEHPDGSIEYNLTLSSMPLDGAGWSMTLTSTDPAALAAFDRQWVRISGSYQDVEYPAADVTSFALVDGAHPVQAWLGTITSENLEGRTVAILETLDGQRLVLASTVRWPDSYTMYTYNGPQQMVFEGVLRTETFGGLPVMEEITWNSSDEISAMTDISQYTMLPRPEFYPYTPPPPLLTGTATVTKIDLAYMFVYAYDEATQTGTTIVQPVWRFSGATDDGTQFVIMVQAVDPAYIE